MTDAYSVLEPTAKGFSSKLLKKYDTFIFDCDGVLYRIATPITGSADALAYLRSQGKKVLFVTNNASVSRAQYLKKFAKLGIEVHEDEMISSAYAAAVYVAETLRLKEQERNKVYVLGMEGIEHELDLVGIEHIGGTHDKWHRTPGLPEDSPFEALAAPGVIDPKVGAVVVGFDVDQNYAKSAQAAKYVMDPEVHFVLTNEDTTTPAFGGPWPEAGPTVAPVINATGRHPIVIGKPHQPILDCVVKAHDVDPKRAIFFGDRLDTDIPFGRKAGFATCLVLSGITNKEAVDHPDRPITPDYVAADIATAVDLANHTPDQWH